MAPSAVPVESGGAPDAAAAAGGAAVAALLALVLTPLNFSWMVASNPATAGWLRTLQIDATGIWFSLLALLGYLGGVATYIGLAQL